MVISRIAIAGFHEGLAGQVTAWFRSVLQGRELACYLHPEAELPVVALGASETRASSRFKFPEGDTYRGLPIIYGDDWPAKLERENVSEIICALPQPEDRKTLYETAREHGFGVPALVHPSAVVLRGARVGEGSIIEPLCYVGLDVDIGTCAQIHAGAQVDHNSVLGDNVTLNPGAIIAGNVRVGEGSTINMGAMVSNSITLGNWTVVGAASFVYSSFPEPHNRLFGVPARHYSR